MYLYAYISTHTELDLRVIYVQLLLNVVTFYLFIHMHTNAPADMFMLYCP